jgi:predicted small lipoprotein YifL
MIFAEYKTARSMIADEWSKTSGVTDRRNLNHSYMNRIIFFLMAGALLVSLSACSGKKGPSAADAPPAQTPQATPADNLPAKLDMNAIPLAEVEKMAGIIEADPAWFQQIKDKAAVGNVPVPIQLKDDARFFLFEHQAEYGIIQIPEDVVQAEIANIRADAAWLESVGKQAKERGISLEESLRRNALYIIDQRLK